MSIARLRAAVSVAEFVSPQNRLRDVVRSIVDSYRIADIILTDEGEVRPWARVLVNGRSHELIRGLETELHDGDSVAFVYPYTENF
jgi:molybdopterin converting factor small subunit